MFTSILNGIEGNLSIQNALLCTAVSLTLGIFIAILYMFQGSYTKNFVVTLAILPALVQLVIMLVNGNVGTSVAVLGTFSLIRFRSVPGSSREIVSIFFSMAVGLATGMGFLTFAGMMTVLTGVVFLLLMKPPFGETGSADKDLRITIAENMDYTEIFEDIFRKYTSKSSLQRVKTTNLGSMFRLTYNITLLSDASVKEMINKLRCRNGNLEITVSKQDNQAIML